MHHGDVIKWNHFPPYWPFVRGIDRSSVDSFHKGQWRGAWMLWYVHEHTIEQTIEISVIWDAIERYRDVQLWYQVTKSQTPITTAIWRCRKPISQWYCGSHLKAALPLIKRLMIASDRSRNIGPWIQTNLLNANVLVDKVTFHIEFQIINFSCVSIFFVGR